jgi:hypothetical protein
MISGIVEKKYQLPKSDKYPSISLTISFSGLPISSAVPPDAGSAPIQQVSLQTTTVPDVQDESAVDSTENTTETATAVVVTESQVVTSLRVALTHAESLKDIPECLSDALGFAKRVADSTKLFTDVRPPFLY